jgi:hypothetical protein
LQGVKGRNAKAKHRRGHSGAPLAANPESRRPRRLAPQPGFRVRAKQDARPGMTVNAALRSVDHLVIDS